MTAMALTYDRRDWMLELLLLLAEAMLLWMTAAVLFSPLASRNDPVPPLLVAGLVAAAAIIPRLAHDRGIWGQSYSIAISLAIAISTAIAVKSVSFPGLPWFDSTWLREASRSLVFEESGADIAVWAPIGLSAVIWWLGRLHDSPGLERARSTLRVGAAVAAMVAIAAGITESGPGSSAISLAIIVFFLATLIALAIARQGRAASQSGRRFGSTVILPAVAIAIMAILSALLVTFDWARIVPRSFPAAGAVLDPFFALLMLLLTGIVLIVALPLLWLLSLGNYENPRMMEFAGFGQDSATQSVLGWDPPDPVRYLLAIIALVAIFYGVARFGFAITRRDPDRDETGDRQFGRGRGLGRWLDRFRWSFVRNHADPLAGLRDDPVWAHTVRVREIYSSWLRWADQRKRGRNIGETAREFDRRGQVLLHTPAASDALDELTSIYEDVRYGHVPATAEQAERAASAWQRLKTNESNATKQP